MNDLTTKQLSFLRSRAHPLQPRIALGKNGLNDGVVERLEAALAEQELVKLKVGKHVAIDPKELAAQLNAALVQKLGRTIVLYRAAEEPKLVLPT